MPRDGVLPRRPQSAAWLRWDPPRGTGEGGGGRGSAPRRRGCGRSSSPGAARGAPAVGQALGPVPEGPSGRCERPWRQRPGPPSPRGAFVQAMAKAVCVNGRKRPAAAGESAEGRQAARKRRKTAGGGPGPAPEVSSRARPGAVREAPRARGGAAFPSYSPFFRFMASHGGCWKLGRNVFYWQPSWRVGSR